MSRNTSLHINRYVGFVLGACLLSFAQAGYAQAVVTSQGTLASMPPMTCAPTGEVSMPSGVSIERILLLDQGQQFKVYTSIEAADHRDITKNAFPPGVAKMVDLSPSSLHRLMADSILRTRRFKVFDMRPNVTAENSDVLITAAVVDAYQVFRTLEGGRQFSQSSVKLSVQIKNMYTGEQLLPADAFVEGLTGVVTGDRVVLRSGEDVNSPEIQQRLVLDFKNAMYRAFENAALRIETLLRPMGRVVSRDGCLVDLFGGSRMGMQANDEVVIFRSQKRQLGETTVLSNTRPVALARCAGVGTENSSCNIVKATAGFAPQDGDYALVTEDSVKRSRGQ